MPRVTVIEKNQQTEIDVEMGANLRRILLDAGISPYTNLTSSVNCGGRGLCATCGVWCEVGEPEPRHWHDQLAFRFGYPRLTCQINVMADMTIRLVSDKIIWGKRDAGRADIFGRNKKE